MTPDDNGYVIDDAGRVSLWARGPLMTMVVIIIGLNSILFKKIFQ